MQDTALIIRANHFAAQKHQNQRRKDAAKTPYINHPIAVARTLLIAGQITDPVILAAALLHDTVEDTDTTFAEIEAEFGPKVTSVVREVTDDKSLPKVARKKLQIEHALTISTEAQLVKAADKYSNLSDILENPPTSWSKEEIEGYIIWCFAVCRNLKNINKPMKDLLDDLFDRFDPNYYFNISESDLNEKLEAYYKIIG